MTAFLSLQNVIKPNPPQQYGIDMKSAQKQQGCSYRGPQPSLKFYYLPLGLFKKPYCHVLWKENKNNNKQKIIVNQLKNVK